MYTAQITNYENLKAGEFPVVQDVVTIASGATLAKGSVLVRGVSGKYSLISGSDAGSVGAFAILLEDCDASTADASAMVAYTGEFAISALTFGEGATAVINKANALVQGLYFKTAL